MRSIPGSAGHAVSCLEEEVFLSHSVRVSHLPVRGGRCLASHPQADGALIKKPCVCSPPPAEVIGGWLFVVGGGAWVQTSHAPVKRLPGMWTRPGMRLKSPNSVALLPG